MKNESIKFKVLQGSFVLEVPFTGEKSESREEIIKTLESIPEFYKITTSKPYAIKENEDGNAIQFTVDVDCDIMIRKKDY